MTRAADTDFRVHCGECGHSWTLAILPMAGADFARLAQAAACPRGCRAKVFCGEGPGCDPVSPQRAGGIARAASMTPEQRRAQARKAARERWRKRGQ